MLKKQNRQKKPDKPDMRTLIRSKNFYLMLLFDACLVAAAYFFSYLLRFEGNIPFRELEKFNATVVWILIFKLLLFMIFGLYRGMWRYTSFVDLFNVLKATTTSSIIIILAVLFIYRFVGFPRSVFILDWILTSIFISGIRVMVRFLLAEKDKGLPPLRKMIRFRSNAKPLRLRKNLLIIGAG